MLLDKVIGVFFLLFVFVSFSTEAPVCLGDTPAPDASWWIVRESYHWGLKARPHRMPTRTRGMNKRHEHQVGAASVIAPTARGGLQSPPFHEHGSATMM